MLELPQIYAENIHRWLPELLFYSLTTLKIGFSSFIVAVAFGILVALCRVSHNRLVRTLAIWFIEIGRGLPIVVMLYIV